MVQGAWDIIFTRGLANPDLTDLNCYWEYCLIGNVPEKTLQSVLILPTSILLKNECHSGWEYILWNCMSFLKRCHCKCLLSSKLKAVQLNIWGCGFFWLGSVNRLDFYHHVPVKEKSQEDWRRVLRWFPWNFLKVIYLIDKNTFLAFDGNDPF